GKNYLRSFEKSILKFFEDAPESLDDAELNKMIELTDELNFLEEYVAPEEPVTEPKYAKRGMKPGRKPKTQAAPETEENQKLAKIMQEVDAMLVSTDDDDDDDDDHEDDDDDDEAGGRAEDGGDSSEGGDEDQEEEHDEDDDDNFSQDELSTKAKKKAKAVQPKTRPKRQATARAEARVRAMQEDSDEDDEDD
ncbi:hypothetical protein BGZ94_003994, partial [Podila epigama]